MASFWTAAGFRANPFGSYTAEKEPELDQYLVRPAYFESLAERSSRIESFLLFGARGAGKSASRIALYKATMSRLSEGETGPLPVTFDSFTTVLRNGIDRVTVAGLVSELAYLTCEATLVWLAALEEEDRHTYVESMDAEEKKLAVWLLDRFYFTRPEPVRQVATRRALELLDQAWPKRTLLWAQKKWNALAGVVGSLAELLAQKATGNPVGLDKGVTSALVADGSANESEFARGVLTRMVDFVRIFGFEGVLVLIDKVDETDVTTGSADATSRLLYPLLANTSLLEVPGIGWMCFLWNKVRDIYAGKLPIRLDKIPNAEINWDGRFLVEMVDRRLAHFSDAKLTHFAEICVPGANATAGLQEMIRCAMHSPRELIRLLDTVVREHEESQRDVDKPTLLDDAAITSGIDRYCVDSVFASYHKATLAQVYRLGRTDFVNKDVQTASRIGDASARQRVRNWCDAGFVAPRGNRIVGLRGKPAVEYTITDQRLRRVIERKLWPENQLDLSLDPPELDPGAGNTAE